ncbi:unnamed protein product [Pleuronectes platessa]|uniref:Uncharacterized protein n=1 Tax=Pleuronectes platessa TaxID=8262 RepID=A0A9N7VIC6_PLEPL|nr:unnamed protein product [Pleuronectes platessa]
MRFWFQTTPCRPTVGVEGPFRLVDPCQELEKTTASGTANKMYARSRTAAWECFGIAGLSGRLYEEAVCENVKVRVICSLSHHFRVTPALKQAFRLDAHQRDCCVRKQTCISVPVSIPLGHGGGAPNSSCVICSISATLRGCQKRVRDERGTTDDFSLGEFEGCSQANE